ncbi:MAG TPA: proton-conducting transporter membrane subunit, partial [Ilumatobacteraceae bacterium]
LLMLALVGAGLIAFGARLGRGAFVVAAVPLSATAAWLVAHVGDVTGGQPVDEQLGWVGGLDLSIDLRLDGLALTMSLVVSIVGVAVLLYAACYFSAAARDLGRLAGLLVLFACSMLALVQADHVLVLYAGWELTTVTSFLLIGNRHDESRARAAALHALLVTGAGGLALLGGLVVIAQQAGTWHLSEVVSDPPGSGTATTVAIVAILFGALTKSAQYPFHAWLPGAMAAPTPVSAYLHSATMVTAGVFLVARIAPAFADLDVWRPIVLTAGSCTMVFGGLRALRQHDLKLLLAFGTVSQLGLLMVLFGAGTAASSTAGWMLLVAHAAFKAALFMVVGIIDHQSGTRDMRAMPPLRDGWRGVEVTTVLAAASMAGVPMAAGFVAKELAYDALDEARFGGHNLVLAIVVVASMLTVAYTARFYLGAFVRPRRRAGAVDTAPSPSRWFAAPAAVLAVAGVVAGVVPSLGDAVASASVAGYGAAFEAHLTLWHGFGTPVLLSAVSLGGGVVLVLADRTVQRVVARGGVIPSGAEVYLFLLRGLGTLSARVTGTVQNGSLPVYAGVILATAAVAPAAALLAGSNWNGWPDVGPSRELLVAVILVVAAIAAATIRRRFAAAVLLSAVGYAMA